MSIWIAATAVERDAGRIAAEYPELWREVRRFNLPVKLALAAAHRVVGSLARPQHARLVGLAPCRPGSPELRAISRELDAGFARGSCDGLRVNPIYTLHAIDNLALSALAIRLENRAACVCLGGAAGQGFAALEHAVDELTWMRGIGRTENASWLPQDLRFRGIAGRATSSRVADSTAGGPAARSPGVTDVDTGSPYAADEVVIFGGDQSEASWRGERSDTVDAQAVGAAIVLTARPARMRLVAVERRPIDLPAGAGVSSRSGEDAHVVEHYRRASAGRDGEGRTPGEAPVAHAAAGIARWLEAVAAAPAGLHRYAVPARDGDGIDQIEIVVEVG